MRMHPRIAINNVAFPGAAVADDIAWWRAMGAAQVSVHSTKMRTEGWDRALNLLQDAKLNVATLYHPFMSRRALDLDDDQVNIERRELSRTLSAAKVLNSKSVYMLTGGRGALSWDEAAQRFANAIAPCVQEAREAGIKLLIEPAPPLYADLHIAHTLRDTIHLAKLAGIGLCVDIFSSWTEAQLRDLIASAMSTCHLVQVGDYIFGDRSFPCRAVPGDGVIPLERIIGWMLEDGYEGAFDLELLGPRIQNEGPFEAVQRGAERLSEVLNRLGA
jgi:sugar phosphate isomerase/epimerase